MYQVIKGPKVTWVDIQNPTEEDIQYLRKRFRFHPLVLAELIPPAHRSKVEHNADYLFMILYYPVHSKEKRETQPRELDIIITKDTIITSHYRSILPLKALFDNCNLYKESRTKYMSQSTGQLLFYILSGFWKACLAKLVKIDKRTDEIEKRIFGGKEKEMVLELSLVKTDVINFWKIIEPQKEILESLAKEGVSFFGREFAPHFAAILGTYSQTRNRLQTFKETILALENTNQSLLSTKINEIIKLLTIFSVIVFPLTLLASIFGMNTAYLPLVGHSFDFWIILGIMITGVIIMITYFYKKKWL